MGSSRAERDRLHEVQPEGRAGRVAGASQKDIGPTLTHKGVAIRHWLEGKEPQEVARAINHSLRAVERYLNHFARVIYCIRHGFSVLQSAFALGISNASVQAYLDIYAEFKSKEGFKLRVAELEAIGAAHHESGDAKKGALLIQRASAARWPLRALLRRVCLAAYPRRFGWHPQSGSTHRRKEQASHE